MILKNCHTEKAVETKRKLEAGEAITEISELDTYISDTAKTSPALIDGINCSPRSFPKMSYACRRQFGKEDTKQIRHFVLSVSPCDNAVDKRKLMDFTRRVCDWFGGRYYIKYAIHHNTAHVHVHILVCNTSFVDGKQLSFGETELLQLKAYCNEAAREFGLKGIDKIDEGDDPYEIDEIRYYETVTFAEKKKSAIVPYDEDKPPQPSAASHPLLPIIFNVVLPPNAKVTVFPNQYGQYIISSKPIPYAFEYGFSPQGNKVCSDFQPYVQTSGYTAYEELVDVPAEEVEATVPNPAQYFLENEVIIDPETGATKVNKKNS